MTVTQERRWTQDGRPSLNRMGVSAVPGPWMDEPDKAHWIDGATDLDCLAVRNGMGAWCGYVAVTEGHPWFAVDYSQCVEGCGEEWCTHSPDAQVQVHGGLTFADFCHESEKGEGFGICHTPLPGRPDRVWWFGFDTAHAGDATPYDHAKAAAENNAYPWTVPDEDVYRSLFYVQSECTDLARQLAAVSA